MSDLKQELHDYMMELPVINSHSHHLLDEEHGVLDLKFILRHSYVNWCGVDFDKGKASRRAYLDKVRCNTYFVWLERALQDLYAIKEPLDENSWDRYSEAIKQANGNPDHHLTLLKKACRYEKIVLDNLEIPGNDNGHPDLFTPTFRINMFLYGYDEDCHDHHGNNPRKVFGLEPHDIDEYIYRMEQIIIQKKRQGCVALKSALAYDRGLDFENVSKEKANTVFKLDKQHITEGDIKAFQDYVFYRICELAAKHDLTLQCHVGLGLLHKTNAMQMHDVIRDNPETRFSLFHGGYPWMDDVLGLMHVYSNVYPDLCWLPLISTGASERFLSECIDVGTNDKVCWGCDTWTAEESYGALLAIRHCLANVLSQKVTDGYMGNEDAMRYVDRILYENPKALYRL